MEDGWSFQRADPPPPPRRALLPFRYAPHPLLPLALLVAPFFTTTIAGGSFSENGGMLGRGTFADGLPFSIPLLLILGTHELGHYVMCRRYGLAATLPYFLPSPFLNLIGTFSSLLRLNDPIPHHT